MAYTELKYLTWSNLIPTWIKRGANLVPIWFYREAESDLHTSIHIFTRLREYVLVTCKDNLVQEYHVPYHTLFFTQIVSEVFLVFLMLQQSDTLIKNIRFFNP